MTEAVAEDSRIRAGDAVAGSALWSSQADMCSVPRDRLIIERGRGAHVWDQHDRRLLDVGSGLWHCNVGHGRAEIAEAASRQVALLETYHTFGRVANRRALELANRLSALAPMDEAKVFLTSGGSDSADTAAKLIRRYWVEAGRAEKRLIVTREGGYHGLHAYGTSLAGIEANREGYGTSSLVPDTARVSAEDPSVFAALLEDRADDVAAIFVEAVIGTGGFIPPTPGYLEEIERLCAAHDVLLVVDEVITGFGRTGALFASRRFGLRPDIVLTAKGLTSGYAPLGAVLVGRRVSEPFWSGPEPAIFRHGLTYSGHATACAVAEANLDILEAERLVARVASLEDELARSLAALDGHPLVTEIKGPVGFMAGVQLESEEIAARVTRLAADHGLLVRAVTGATLGICPPFVIEVEELRALGGRLRAVLDEVDA